MLGFVAGAYVDLLRSLPLVLLIFWFYFLVPIVVGHPVGGFYSAVIGFILFEAAYFCEIIRSGIAERPPRPGHGRRSRAG